jgi:hypothetical protein
VVQILKKSSKRALSGAIPRTLLRYAVQILEKAVPNSPLLVSLYQLVIGLHGFAGVRAGLRRFDKVGPG